MQFTIAGKKAYRKNARTIREKYAVRCRSKNELVKTVGGESENKKEIKIHERFKQRQIKIHGGIIADFLKTKACDSS